jgi:hypothetical protein
LAGASAGEPEYQALIAPEYIQTTIHAHFTTSISGPADVGKSHLAQGLGHEACRRGFDVGFISAARMLGHLHGGRADGTCEPWLLVRTRSEQRTHRLDANGDRNRSECRERLGGLLNFYHRQAA